MLSRPPTRVVRDWTCDSTRWIGYKPRVGDVIIATAPKVGTTWMQQIVNLLIFQSPQPRTLGQLSPWIDCRFRLPIEEQLPIIEAQTHRRFLKSHLPLDALPIYDEVRYIHVARDARDACMSLLNHYNSFTPEALEGFDRIGLSDDTINLSFPRLPKTEREFFLYWIADSKKDAPMRMSDFFFSLERSFWTERRRPNLLLVHYNDLKADLSGEMKRIAEFLGITTPDALWPELVEAASFEAMKRDGATLMAGAERHFVGGHQSFLYRGTNSRWRGVLNDADLELYERKINANLSPSLIRWLTEGSLVAGDPRSSPD
jgi:aryl sulfotransferase